MGLARPSLYLSLDEPSFPARLSQEFAEHVPGFFGKQRTKAMKRQLDGNMLWRQMLAAKKQSKEPWNLQKGANFSVNGRKLSEMSPDERVEAMIKRGMI
jgi:hypothetical protein